MLYEEARAIRCDMDIQWGEPNIKARMRCITQPDAEIQPLIKHFPHANLSSMPPATPPSPQMPNPQQQQPPSVLTTNQGTQLAGNQQTPNNQQLQQPGANQPSVTQSQRKTVRIPLSHEHFTRTEQIIGQEGVELVRSINVSRAAISKRKLTLPTGLRLGVLVWSDELAKKALHRLGTRENHYIEVIDLQVEVKP